MDLMATAQSTVLQPPATPILSLRGVGVTYNSALAALSDVSFDLNEGEFCVLLGASGAGKSTLIKTINGLAPPTVGEIEFDDANVCDPLTPEKRSRIATIHQHFNLSGRLSVAQNILSGAAPQMPLWRCLSQWYPPKLRYRAAKLAERVGLPTDCLNRRAHLLSGGQQQRVGIARALILSPNLILADEPVASLDPQNAHAVLALLRSCALERRAAVICSLHQPELARIFADRIIAMRTGRIVFDGPPQALTPKRVNELYRGGGSDGICSAA